jgi:hypothetical protein
LNDIFEHWVAPVQGEHLSRAVSGGSLILWTSKNSRVDAIESNSFSSDSV